MLGGDAPDQNEMKCFTKESAELLVKRLEFLMNESDKKRKIIVQNGPRTGKHDP